MLIFQDAPPPAAEWSAIMRDAWASAPVSASSSRSRSGPAGPAMMARRRALSARRLRVVNSSPKSCSPARSSLRVCQPRKTGGRGAPPSPPAAARRARSWSPGVGSSRRVPPHAAQVTSTAVTVAPERAVPASLASAPQRRQRVRCQRASSANASASTARPRSARASASTRASVARASATANGLASTPTAARPAIAASTTATPDPQKGSSTRPPGGACRTTRSATTSAGLRDQYLCSR